MNQSAQEIKKFVVKFWPKDLDLAGEEAVERVVQTVSMGRAVSIHDSIGDAEFPYDDVLIRLAAIATIIATSLQIVSTLNVKECHENNIANIITKIEFQLPKENRNIIESIEFKKFIREILNEKARDF